MTTCTQCGKPMLLADIRLLATLPAGSAHPRNGEPVTSAVKVFTCTRRFCPGRYKPVEHPIGAAGNCELR